MGTHADDDTWARLPSPRPAKNTLQPVTPDTAGQGGGLTR
jgi:hypothetical protein